jgi:hypothetical protein
MPSPGPNQVVVQMKTTGICGSDVHYYHHGACGMFKLQGPIVLGTMCLPLPCFPLLTLPAASVAMPCLVF